ncbi:hypothetical protein C5B85_00060 [Pseudoclavibacter sp. AY1F1]|uniref:hypothetical protein n=1 Tax=Pseudoclavibacter sp. AY1F1 TaxID=2080583 RepID=UPI000CE7AE5C|nr:hypothetical protein [Pseudoclavibacter sp. AY1F1]PPF46729.1 hypothetical protein C5B85_00060 [Pseudoclavibacter sp. AY1F1]
MTRTNRTAANELRKLDQQWAAEEHQALVAWFTRYPDTAAGELLELKGYLSTLDLRSVRR